MQELCCKNCAASTLSKYLLFNRFAHSAGPGRPFKVAGQFVDRTRPVKPSHVQTIGLYTCMGTNAMSGVSGFTDETHNHNRNNHKQVASRIAGGNTTDTGSMQTGRIGTSTAGTCPPPKELGRTTVNTRNDTAAIPQPPLPRSKASQHSIFIMNLEHRQPRLWGCLSRPIAREWACSRA